MSILCSMVGASFVTAAAEVIRHKKGIQAFGNAQIDNAQSKFGGTSALFDGTDDYLVATGDFSQAGDFTIECWFRASRVTGAQILMTIGNEASERATLYLDGSTLKYDTFSSGTPDITCSGTISTGVWYHVAAVRSGSTITVYRDGSSVGSASKTGTVGNATNAYFGADSNGLSDYQGWMDEIRYSNTARYTTNFTPSTTPFVNDSNTLLLIHADGTDASTFFEDDNGVRRSLGLSAGNQAQISTAQSKFGGSSIVYDGTDDFVSITNMPSTASSDFTFEFWARFDILPWNQTAGGGSYMIAGYTGGNLPYYMIGRSGASGSQPLMQIALPGERYGSFTKSGLTLAVDTWYHLAYVRTGGVCKCFFNGTELTTFTNDYQFTNSGRTEEMSFTQLGKFSDSRGSWDGFMDEIRVSNTARYTADFTPSTTPFVNDSNTLLLIHGDGTNGSTVFRDDNGTGRTQKGIQAFGNAQIDNAQSKFGGTSALFDGDVDYLTTDATGSLTFGTNDLTFEMWVRPIAKTRGFPVIFGNESGSGFTSNSYILMDRHTSYNTKFTFWAFNHSSGSPLLTSSTSVSNGTWYHIAVVRNGSSWKMYINGTEESSATFSGSLDTSGRNLIFGVSGNLAIDTSYHGYLDEIRISNTARYTANFTAPTTQFQNDSNTLLLLHCDGTDGSTVFVDDNGRTTTP